MNKKIYPALFLMLALAFSAAAFGLIDVFSGIFSAPEIKDAKLSLEKVIPGEELTITIEAEDAFGIKKVGAEIQHERGTDYVSFNLISGNDEKGVWKGTWDVHDTLADKEYKAIVTVVNRHNQEAKIELTFTDPVVSHTPDQIVPQGAGSGLDSDQVDAFHAADLLAQGGGNSGLVYKRAFVTSTAYNGNLGGLSGADAKCQARADAASLGGTWRAILSTGTIDAIDRVGYKWDVLINMQGGIIAIWPRAAATVAANGQSDLWNDALLRPIKYDEFGSSQVGQGAVWTGTISYFDSASAGGTSSSQHCLSWTSQSSGGEGMSGTAGGTGPQWIHDNDISNTQCIINRKIYCIEQ